MSVNKVILMGNLTIDPELKTFQNGGQIVKLRLATNERAYTTSSGQQVPEKVQYHTIIIKGKYGDTAMKYLKKGDPLYLEGSINNRKYTDANNVEREVTEIILDSFEMIGSKKKNTPVEAKETVTNDNNNDLPF